MVSGPLAGLLTGALLLVNPLYAMHARRAVNDMPCLALGLIALTLALPWWRRTLEGRGWAATNLALAAATGAMTGLSVLAKLTGLYLVLAVLALAGLALVLPGHPGRRRREVVAGAALIVAIAGAVFVVGNPSLTATPTHPPPNDDLDPSYARLGPLGRFRETLALRRRISGLQQRAYPQYALPRLRDRVGVYLVQGFGRYGPSGPPFANVPARYLWRFDRGAIVWLPWVTAGVAWAVVRGRRQSRNGQAPTAWALLTVGAVATVCVVGYLPMAWDRYLLPVQPFHALLAAGAAAAGLSALRHRLAGTERRLARDGG
jgi:4-amino-4-deoxy-L-arabinose transferase-like glycosyltransferase